MVRDAVATAKMFTVVKYVLIVINIAAGVYIFNVGQNMSVSSGIVAIEGGGTAPVADNSTASSIGSLLQAYGVSEMVIGTVLILMFFGWFASMLRLSARRTELAELHQLRQEKISLPVNHQ